MRQLTHPKIEDITVEGILHAMGDPVRARIFIALAGARCTTNCSAFLNISETPLAKSTLSQHFKILREAGLITSERKGVELQNKTRCDETKDRFGLMINAIVKTFLEQEKRNIP